MMRLTCRRAGRRPALLGATMLAGLSPALSTGAVAAQFPVVLQQAADPLTSGLQVPPNAAQVGMWGPLQPWPLISVSAALLPSGKVATYGSPLGVGAQDGRTYDVWDPTQGLGKGHTTLPGLSTVNSFCAAQAFRTDGSLLISGGIFNGSQDKGSAVLNAGASGVSALSANMADDRYYATMLTQPDGSQLILGGSYPYAPGWNGPPQTAVSNGWFTGMTPEVYRNGGWSALLGATSRDAFGPDNQRFWYPHAWVAPNGKIFGISSDNMWYLDSTGNGTVSFSSFKAPPTAVNAPGPTAPNTGPTSTAAMYDRGKAIQVGGNSMTNIVGNGNYFSSSAATTIDITGANVAVKDTTPMAYPRAWANSTVLPTGKVLVNGGSAYDDQAGGYAQHATETWDPATGQWTVGPIEAAYRGYHSTAVLLQDGAVLMSGGGVPGPVNNFSAQVYYPPYLFTAANGQSQLAQRPRIVSLSGNAPGYGQTLQVEVGSNAAIAQVVLIGLSEVTHSFNSGQRRYPLAFTQAGTVLKAQTPASGSEAPPGYYQLVAIDANGVPSAGAIIGLGSGVAAPGTTAVPVQGSNTGASVPAIASSVAAPGNGGWTQFGVRGQRVAVGADGTTVVVNSDNNSVWQYVSDNNWKQLPWQMRYVAVRSAQSIWGIGMDNNIYRFDGSNWSFVGYNASTVSVSADGTVAVTNPANEIWYKATDDTVNAWTKIPNWQARRVAVASAHSLWIVGMDTNIYRMDLTGNGALAGYAAAEIAASADGTVTVASANDQSVWQKVTDDTNNAWTQLPWGWKAVSVAAAGAGRTIVVGLDQQVWRN